MNREHTRGARRGTAGPLALGTAIFAVALAGCDGILDVSLPGQTPADALNSPGSAALLVSSAQGDFECAFSNYAFTTALVAGELMGAQSSLTLIPYQRRNVRPIDTGFAEDSCAGSGGEVPPFSVPGLMRA